MYVFKILYLVKTGWLSGHLLGNSCSLDLRYVSFVLVPACQFIFPFSIFGLDLTAPFLVIDYSNLSTLLV